MKELSGKRVIFVEFFLKSIQKYFHEREIEKKEWFLDEIKQCFVAYIFIICTLNMIITQNLLEYIHRFD